MENLDLKISIERGRRRHIFSKFKFELRFIVMPVFMLFGVLDYIYKPEFVVEWVALRFFVLLYVFVGFQALRVSAVRRKYYEYLAVSCIVVCANAVNIMIWQSGGYESLYPAGVILICTTAISYFRLSKSAAIAASTMSYFPAIGIIMYSGGLNNWRPAVTQSGMLLGMVILTWIYRSSEDVVSEAWTKARIKNKNEIIKFKKTEFLKRHFPKSLRDKLDNHEFKLEKKKLIENAVVGFADITSSTQLANVMNINRDWELKERFLESATMRATQCGLIVLNHLGDGFLFLANYNETEDWSLNIISFFEHLLSDFDDLKSELCLEAAGIDTGIKCSVSSGPSIVGFIGKDQSYFTAMGPDVNLAARLVGKAQNNELVVSSRVWYVLKNYMIGWNTEKIILTNLKGFDEDIPAVRIKPRTVKSSVKSCAECGEKLAIMRTPEGFFDFSCPNGHSAVDMFSAPKLKAKSS